jgi:lysophospholipase L1-like esterase
VDGWAENAVLVAFAVLPCALLSGLRRFFAAQRRRPRRGPLRLVAGNLLVFAFLCSTTLLPGELWLRFGRDTTQSFLREKVARRWMVRHWRTNGFGVRDDVEYTAAAPPGRRRILFLGDSFTAGQGVEVAERFGNRIRAARPDWDVQVVADLGWDTREQTRVAQSLVERGHDLGTVVLCYCPNDTTDVADDLLEMLKRLEHQPDPPPVVRHSYLLDWLWWRMVFARRDTEGEYVRLLAATYEGATWDVQQRRLTELRRLVESGGGRFAVVTFPFLGTGADDPFRAALDRLDRFWREQGVPHLDLREAFAPHPPASLAVNRWDLHPNAKANGIAAEEIVRFLDGL